MELLGGAVFLVFLVVILVSLIIGLSALASKISNSPRGNQSDQTSGEDDEPEEDTSSEGKYTVKVIYPETGQTIFSDTTSADGVDYDSGHRRVNYCRDNGKEVVLFCGHNLVVLEEQ